jgi:hypothetical protein
MALKCVGMTASECLRHPLQAVKIVSEAYDMQPVLVVEMSKQLLNP